MITYYIVGGGGREDRTAAYTWMKNHFALYTTCVYLNYPELELDNYAEMYWGKSRPRLSQLKTRYDPENLFYNPQPIPQANTCSSKKA